MYLGTSGSYIDNYKTKIFLNHSFILRFFPQLTIGRCDNPPVILVTMGPVGLMKSTRKQKLIAMIGFFLEFFSQLISTTGSQNRSPDFIAYYGIWARVSIKRALALFSDVVHASWISHLKAESISFQYHLAKKSL